MLSVDQIKVESDERGFELHILDDEGDWHIFNVHGAAMELYATVVGTIGPWVREAEQAAAELGRRPELLEREPGESAQDYFERTGDGEPLREEADAARKAAKENG